MFNALTSVTYETVLILLHDIINYPLFKLQDTPITLLAILLFVAVIAGSYLISIYIRKLYDRRLTTRFSSGIDFTVKRLIHYTVLIIGFLVAFEIAGIDLSSLAIIAGFLSVGIGFGLQNITSNFISGLILLFERPIEVGDTVTVGDQLGTVTGINLRATEVNTWENIDIIIPNSAFVEDNVINWSHGEEYIRVSCPVGVAYGADTEKVRDILYEIAREHPKVLDTPEPNVLFLEFGDSSLDFELRIWIRTPRRRNWIKSEINYEIDQRFREENIEIPFPQRDLHLRSATELRLKQADTNRQGD